MRSQRHIYSDGVASELGYEPVTGLGGVAATTLVIQDADITTKASAPTLSIGVIALTVNKGTIVTKGASPVLAVGVITLTVASADVVTLADNVVLVASGSTPVVVEQKRGGGHAIRSIQVHNWPQRTYEDEEVLSARAIHAAEVEQVRAMDMQRREQLDLARRQASVNRRLEALKPQVQSPQQDTGKLFRELAIRREVAARMEKQNEEIERQRKLINRVKMARVRSHIGKKK